VTSEDAVASVDDLIAVVTDMWSDLELDPASWANPTLDRFLQAMVAWLDDLPTPPPAAHCQFVADLLRAARRFE
jgi:hypothetical protein